MNTILQLAFRSRSTSSGHHSVAADSRNKAFLLILVLASGLFGFSPNGGAARIPVTTNADSGAGSLRAAITAANANPDPDIIEFEFAGIIQLASALPQLLHELQIVGLRATANSVQPVSGVQCRIFAVATGATVTISDLTIRNGVRALTVVGGNGVGGGIFNAGKLTLRRCEIQGNQAIGANNPNSNGNGGSGRGGGIYNQSDGTLTVDHCTVAGNRAEGGSGNASSGTGGLGLGGGIYNEGALTIVSSTLSSNTAEGGSGDTDGAAYGGGLYSRDTPVVPSLISCTISNNISSGSGGGVLISNSACSARNSILAQNTAPEKPDCAGTIVSEDYNLIQNTTGCTVTGQTSHNIVDELAYLGALANNGGPTRTHALTIDSPARDNGDDTIINAPLNITTDQRLLTRKDGGVDIGAYEAAASPVPPEDFNGDQKLDYALFRSSDRKTAIWYLNGPAFAGSSYGPTLPGGWQLIDCGDLNGDAQSDYLLFNSATRRTAMWFLANATLIGGEYGPTLPEGWVPVGTGNFIADTDREYLFFKPATRQTAIWTVDGSTVLAAKYGPTLPAGWSLVGAGNFGGNALYDDYLLYNPATRQTAVWLLDAGAGYTLSDSAYGPTAPSGWEVLGTGDFNANNRSDLVLVNTNTRKTAIWYLNGATYVSGVFGPTLPDGWQLISP